MGDSEFITLNEDGVLVAINYHTGETRQLDAAPNPVETTEDRYIKVKNEEGELVWIPRTASSEDMRKLQGKRFSFPYSPLLADRICEMVTEGKTITDICKMNNYPSYSQLCKWRKEFPEFQEALKQAREDRAEIMFDKAIQAVESAGTDRDEINLAKAKADIYKTAAKVYNPKDYGDKQQIDAKVASTSFVLETGIRRPGDEGYFTDETAKIREVNNGDV